MPNNEMVTRIDIGDTGRQMVITKNAQGKVKSVEDDKGKKANESSVGMKIANENFNENGKPGHFRSNITGMRDGTVIITHHNPTCCWYYTSGTWYWLCY